MLWQAAFVAEGAIIATALCWLRWRSPWASPRRPVSMPLTVGLAIWAGVIMAVCVGCAKLPEPYSRHGWQPFDPIGERRI